ncbi:MAG TPA: pilus (MSHA type) biogenesis protein MshL, partial [Pseudomonadales bacterium]|nr:pilus (MSHA type) biogenesis protein MshL [Pseudomonadales bacterium]
ALNSGSLTPVAPLINQNVPTLTDATKNPSGIFSAAFALNDFNGVIQLLQNQGNVQVLSSPRISTVNNQKAVIKVGTDEFFVTKVSSSTTTSSVTTTPTQDITITPFFSGIALDVTPQIGEDDQVTLHVHPTVSQVTDQKKEVTLGQSSFVLPLALSSIRESDSIVRARSNQIIVIGGLLQSKSEDADASVPWLSNIPGINVLFKSKRQSMKKSELVILLKPVVVSDDEDWNKMLGETADRYSDLR